MVTMMFACKILACILTEQNHDWRSACGYMKFPNVRYHVPEFPRFKFDSNICKGQRNQVKICHVVRTSTVKTPRSSPMKELDTDALMTATTNNQSELWVLTKVKGGNPTTTINAYMSRQSHFSAVDTYIYSK